MRSGGAQTAARGAPGRREEAARARLVDAVRERCGVDLSGYAPEVLDRLVAAGIARERVRDAPALADRILDAPESLERLLSSLWVGATALFRDPGFFRDLRRFAFPRLRAVRWPRIWVAGCSTGEEAYSLAILLRDEGLHSRCRVFATDVNASAVARARAGVYPAAAFREATRRYHAAGGRGFLSASYVARDGRVTLDPALRSRIVFAVHDLASGKSFHDVDLVLCRNVLIWFGADLRRRVHDLFWRSLRPEGVLALGAREGLEDAPAAAGYARLAGRAPLWARGA